MLQKPQKIPTPIDFRISNVIINALFIARLVTESHLVSYATGNWCGHYAYRSIVRWVEIDLNYRRPLSHQIYSLTPLTTRTSTQERATPRFYTFPDYELLPHLADLPGLPRTEVSRTCNKLIREQRNVTRGLSLARHLNP